MKKTLAALGLVVASLTAAAPAAADPIGIYGDPHYPIPPSWCPGGGTQTGWGGFCDGVAFADNTKWHIDSYVAPFVGRVWNPLVCVVADAPAPPPLAPGGCAR